MGRILKVGIIGAGWPGAAHARGYQAAGGFELYAVADLVPARREQFCTEFALKTRYASADDLLADKFVDVVSICLPNHLHATTALAALRAGKHVICETPPAISPKEVRQMGKAAEKNARVLLFSLQRRFGGCEQAARQAVAKSLLGDVYHVRAAWMRTRAVPAGTGWYPLKSQSGGGAMADLGLQMLDIGWNLLGDPVPQTVFAATHHRLNPLAEGNFDVEECATAIVRFADGKCLELAASWAINQPPQQNGAVCRACGTQGALEVYTNDGAVLYRDFDPAGNCKAIPLKGPTMIHHGAMMRHFKDCIAGKSTPQIGSDRAATMMEILQAVYKSAESGKSVNL